MLPEPEKAPVGPDKWPTFGISTFSAWLESTETVIFFPTGLTDETLCIVDDEEEFQGVEQLTVRSEIPISSIITILLGIMTLNSSLLIGNGSTLPQRPVCVYDATLVL